jgi:type IV secretory pathway TrbF-like protein
MSVPTKATTNGTPGTSSPPIQLRPLEDAKRQYVELFGSALVLNTYLKIALLAVSALAMGLLVLNFRTQHRYADIKPLVIRIDDVGRAQAVQYDALTYHPQGQAPELKYFLTQFVVDHFARMRATVRQRYADSLYFLDSALADATVAEDARTKAIETFLAGNGDETEVQVRNVTLDDLKTPPYKAAVDFDEVFYAQGNRAEKARSTFVAQLTFVIRDQVPNAMIPVNPLGLTMTYFRVDQAFR